MKLKHSIIVLTLLIIVFMAISGCEPQPLSGPERSALEQYGQSVNQLGDFIESQELLLAQLEQTFEQTGDEDGKETIADVRAALDEAKIVASQVATGLNNASQASTNVEAVQTGITSVGQVAAPYAGPYAPLVLSLSHLIALIVGNFNGKKVGDEKIKSYNKAIERTQGTKTD